MKVFELPTDGKLTREMVRDYGDAFTIQERLENKNYGLGHLRLKNAHKSILKLYEQENNTIKTHFEWTKNGAVIRMRTITKLYAIGITDNQIAFVTLTKAPDYVYAIPLLPFWILLKLGVKLSIAKWFKLRGDTLIYGPCLIQLSLTDSQMLTYQLDGSLWNDCLSTFKIDKIKERLKIVDERSTTTNNA
jgi:hypothetical protein